MKFNRILIFSMLTAAIALLSFVPVKKKRTAAKKTNAGKVKKAVEPETISNPYYIIVDKSEYELYVYDDEGWYATYPIVFGSKDLSDKMKEGDKKTPDGTFKIIIKKIHPKWGPELLLDYPNQTSVEKFKERKAKGILPRGAKIGNGIAISGVHLHGIGTVNAKLVCQCL